MKRFRLLVENSVDFDPETQRKEWLEDRVDYVACLRTVIRRPLGWPNQGADLIEQEQGLRVLKELAGKKAGDILALEDADHEHLCAKARAYKWGVIDDRIVRFTKTILNATEDVLDLETPPEHKEEHARADVEPSSSTPANGQVAEALAR